MDSRNYHLSHALVIIHLYHIDIDASMIWQRISVDIGLGCLKRHHFLVDQILNIVFEIDTTLSIMSNVFGVISTPLVGFVEFGTSIHPA